MKELSIEEKAKRYEEAIRESSKIINHCAGGTNIPECVSVKATIEQIFPELKESEDERIRKAITEFFKNFSKNGTYRTIPDVTKWISWLEKQGEQKSVDGLTQQEAMDIAVAKCFEQDEQKETLCDKCKKVQPSHSCQDITALGRCAVEHEQKPADKVEPKFHKGDWIVFNGLTLYIKEVVKGFYRTISKGGITNSYDWNIDNIARLWTIQEAKDGDVLQLGKVTVIFKGFIGNGNCRCYCSVCDGEFEIPSKDGADNSYGCHNATPATKGQRDTLEKAMTDAGYTFDFEKKELKKRQKHTPKHKVGDTIYYNSFGDVKSMIITNVVTDSTDNPMYEDENGNIVFEEDIIDYNTAWNEEDEKICLDILQYFKDGYGLEHTIESIVDWFESLKNRVQPKQEWSEEDEEMLCRCISATFDHGYLKECNWLKSLRPQNRWKPSDEQMEVLLSEVNAWTKGCPKQKVLESLYNDLKKLREK